MVHIDISHTFPVTVNEGFAFITKMGNWPEYWPAFVRFQAPAHARWATPGDEVTIVLRLLGRERAIHLKLEELRPDSLVSYRSYQQGLPAARHERHFTAVADGLEYRLVVAYEPRSGVAGLFDRFVLKRAVEHALRKTIANLDRLLTKQGLRN